MKIKGVRDAFRNIKSNEEKNGQIMKLNYREDGTQVSEEVYWPAGSRKVLYGADQNKTLFRQDCNDIICYFIRSTIVLKQN